MKAFTVVELMITVGIVAILAALAVPSVVDMQLKAKRAEVPLVSQGIAKAMTAYLIDAPATTPWLQHHPDPAGMGKAARGWGAPGGDWERVDFEPDGLVRGVYNGAAVDGLRGYGAGGNADLDEDKDGYYFVVQVNLTEGKVSWEREGCYWALLDAFTKPLLPPVQCY